MSTYNRKTIIHAAMTALLIIMLVITGTVIAEAEDSTAGDVLPEKLEQPEYTGKTEFNLVYGCDPFEIEVPNETSVTFRSTNRNVVTVTAGYGESICYVKVKSSGTAEIIATVSESEKYKGKEYRFKVKVVKASQTIELTKRNIYGYYCYGRGWSLEPIAQTDCICETSNSKIASVSRGSVISLVNPGRATITITAIETDKYKKAVMKVPVYSYLMKPAIKLRRYSKGRIKISWNSVPGAHRYQVYVYDSAKKKYMCRATRGSWVKSVTHSGLKAGKTYWYKVRAYRIVDGKRVYSSFSAAKKAVARR